MIVDFLAAEEIPLGKCLVSRAGHTAGPVYGEIYATEGGHAGVVAVVRRTDDPSYWRAVRFETQAHAEAYLAQLSAY